MKGSPRRLFICAGMRVTPYLDVNNQFEYYLMTSVAINSCR